MSINIFEFNVRRFEKTPFDFYDLLLLTDDRIEEGVADVKPVPMKDIRFNDDFKKKPKNWKNGYYATAEFALPLTKEPNSPRDYFIVKIGGDRRGVNITFSHEGGTGSEPIGYSSRQAGSADARSSDFSNRLFATVVAVIKKLVKSHKPPGIAFSSAGRGRTKLYKRLTQMFAGDFEDAGSRMSPRDRGGSFRLKKRGAKTTKKDLMFITDVADKDNVIFLKDHRNDTPMIILPTSDTKEVENAEAELARHQQELDGLRGSSSRTAYPVLDRLIEKDRIGVSKAKRDMKLVNRINMAAYLKAVKAVGAKKKRLQKAGADDFIEIAEVTTAKKAIEMLVMRGLKKGTKIHLSNYPGTMAFINGFMRKGLV